MNPISSSGRERGFQPRQPNFSLTSLLTTYDSVIWRINKWLLCRFKRCLTVCAVIPIAHTRSPLTFGNSYKTVFVFSFISTNIALYWPAAEPRGLIASQRRFNCLLLWASNMLLFPGFANFPKWIPGWIFPPLSLISLDGGLNFNLVIAAVVAAFVFLCVLVQ